MYSHNIVLIYGLMAFGALYTAKPDIFYMWMAKRDANGQRREMPEQNKIFMRGLGLLFLLSAMMLLWRANS